MTVEPATELGAMGDLVAGGLLPACHVVVGSGEPGERLASARIEGKPRGLVVVQRLLVRKPSTGKARGGRRQQGMKLKVYPRVAYSSAA